MAALSRHSKVVLGRLRYGSTLRGVDLDQILIGVEIVDHQKRAVSRAHCLVVIGQQQVTVTLPDLNLAVLTLLTFEVGEE